MTKPATLARDKAVPTRKGKHISMVDMNNKTRARYLARVVSVLTTRLAPEDREIRLTMKELNNTADVGFEVDELGNLLIALGDA